jgi:hypothetical protein
LGFSKIASPSTSASASTPAPRSCEVAFTFLRRFGPSLPRDRSRSTFTVSRRLDGLLRLKPCGFVAPRCRSWGSPRFGFRLLPLRVRTFTFLDGASTLRSFSLAFSRPSRPSGRILPSCRCLLPRRSEDLRVLSQLRTPCGVLGFLGALTWNQADFRALSRRSSPPRTVDVSIHWRVLLPWVSHSARDLILIGLSPFLLRILAEACGVWRRALP